MTSLKDLTEEYRGRRAPPGMLDAALARYQEKQGQGSAWPVWGAVAVMVCAAVVVPNLVNQDAPHQGEEINLRTLSLNRLAMPTGPTLSTSTRAVSELSSSTRLPLRVPNLSQLSVTRSQEKETM